MRKMVFLFPVSYSFPIVSRAKLYFEGYRIFRFWGHKLKEEGKMKLGLKYETLWAIIIDININNDKMVKRRYKRNMGQNKCLY